MELTATQHSIAVFSQVTNNNNNNNNTQLFSPVSSEANSDAQSDSSSPLQFTNTLVEVKSEQSLCDCGNDISLNLISGRYCNSLKKEDEKKNTKEKLKFTRVTLPKNSNEDCKLNEFILCYNDKSQIFDDNTIYCGFCKIPVPKSVWWQHCNLVGDQELKKLTRSNKQVPEFVPFTLDSTNHWRLIQGPTVIEMFNKIQSLKKGLEEFNSRYDKVLAQSTIYELSLRGSMAHESSTSMYIKEIHKTMTEKIEQVQAVVAKKEGIIKHLESQLRKCAINTENQKKEQNQIIEFLYKAKEEVDKKVNDCIEECAVLRQEKEQHRQEIEILKKELEARPIIDSNNEQIKSLQAENDRLIDEKLCIICHINYRNAIIQPCNHLHTCMDCALKLYRKKKQNDKKCPECNSKIGSLYICNIFERMQDS